MSASHTHPCYHLSNLYEMKRDIGMVEVQQEFHIQSLYLHYYKVRKSVKKMVGMGLRWGRWGYGTLVALVFSSPTFNFDFHNSAVAVWTRSSPSSALRAKAWPV